MKSQSNNEVNIEVDGILVPHQWSKKNRVTSVSIHTAGELEYLIDSNSKFGKELKKLLGKRVIVEGRLSPDDSPPKKLSVSSYRIFEW